MPAIMRSDETDRDGSTLETMERVGAGEISSLSGSTLDILFGELPLRELGPLYVPPTQAWALLCQ